MDTKRKPGRPRTEYIFKFSIATDLTLNKRFIAFRIALGVDEQKAWLTLARFYNFVAQNRAVTGSLKDELPLVIAAFCWFEGDPETLMKALGESGIIEQDGTVHEWHANQFLATKKLKERQSGQDESAAGEPSELQGKDNSREITPIIANNRTDYLPPISLSSSLSLSKKEEEKSLPVGKTPSTQIGDLSGRVSGMVDLWNGVHSDYPKVPEVVKGLVKGNRLKVVEQALEDPDFNFDLVLEGLKASEWHRGDKSDWVATWDWVFNGNWKKLLEKGLAAKSIRPSKPAIEYDEHGVSIVNE